VTMYSLKVGSDANGSSYVANMKSEKVDVNSVEIVPNVPTGVASIMVGTSDGTILMDWLSY